MSGLCRTCQVAIETSHAPADSPAAASVGGQTASYRPVLSDGETVTEARAAARPADVAGQAPAPRRAGMPPAPLGYELIREFEGGGMGVVYLAREHATERTVAMKFLRGVANGSAVERFLIELRALSALDHPNIVRVLGHDFYRADPFFTMEYQPGGTLGDLVKRRGPLPPAEAVGLIRSVAEAVRAAHAKGILHRDIKPNNILLDADGVPKVSDFGLAKRTDTDDGITVGSGVIGTPSYMPPEQVSKKWGEVGPASDVYGLGATLYHLLTGRVPFRGESNNDTMNLVEREPPKRPRAIRPEIPLALEAVVMKCLEKNPADRYPSVEAFVADLDNCLADEKAVAAPLLTPARRLRLWVAGHRWRLAGVVGALAVAIGLVLGGLALAPVPKSPDPPDLMAEMQKELAAGRSVTLVRQTGLPKWYAWKLTPCQFGDSPLNDGTATFQTAAVTLLELLSDPGIDRYRVTFQIRHVNGNPPPPGGPLSLSCVGVYFGHAPTATHDRLMNTLYAVRYTDLAPRPVPGKPVRSIVQFGDAIYPQQPDQQPVSSWNGTGGVPFQAQDAPWRGEWREIVIEVTPDAVGVYWREKLDGKLVEVYRMTGEESRTRYAAIGTRIGRWVPGANVVPQWHPRMPLGIIADHSTVSIRNVVIEPLP